MASSPAAATIAGEIFGAWHARGHVGVDEPHVHADDVRALLRKLESSAIGKAPEPQPLRRRRRWRPGR